MLVSIFVFLAFDFLMVYNTTIMYVVGRYHNMYIAISENIKDDIMQYNTLCRRLFLTLFRQKIVRYDNMLNILFLNYRLR